MNKIKIGQIGICHEHASGKIATLRKMSDVYEIVGVVDDRSTTAARFAGDNLEPYEGLNFMSEEELLAVPGLQAVAIETPNMDLVPTAIRCMERGLHMHMDKPAGDNLELFDQLLAGCKEKRLALQLGYMLRTNPVVQFCQKAIEKGWLGDIFRIDADFNHCYGGEPYPPYLANFKGGIMFNLGCHLIDMITSIMGRPENVLAFPKATPGIASGTNNNGLAVLEYQYATATVRSCNLEVDGNANRRLVVSGSKGTVEVCPMERYDGKPLEFRLSLLEDNKEYSAGTQTVKVDGMTDRYEGQLLELSRIINGEIDNPYTYDHDRLVHEIVLAAAGYSKW